MLFFASEAAALNPEDDVWVFMLENEGELHMKFLGAPGEGESLLGFGWHVFDLGCDAHQRLLDSNQLVSVPLQELMPILEGKSALTFR